MKYKQLTLEQRYAIYLGRQEKNGKKESLSSIARKIGVSVSTVSREIRRNLNNSAHYIYDEAHELAMVKRERSCANRVVKSWILQDAIELLKTEQWSPQQISVYLKSKGESISHERIYAYIREHPELNVYCRNKMKYKRRTKKPKATKATNIPNRTSIHERPAEADGSRFGDWELDLIVGAGQKSCLVTLVERSNSYILIKRLDTKHHSAVAKAVIQMLFAFRGTEALKTITTDNGIEFYDHMEFAKVLKTKVYFADSYCSWQKGAIENANKLIRQYFPKGTDFRQVSDSEVKAVQFKLNRRPRRKLGFSTPVREFYKQIH